MESQRTQTDEQLFLVSFEGAYDDDEPWDAIRSLRQRDTDEVFNLAAAYCRSVTPLHRARALDVLAQLGAGKPLSERPHFDESVAIALAHLGDEDPLVVHSAAWALAHLNDKRAAMALIELTQHDDPDIRWAVANGMVNHQEPEAISTLIELMNDTNDQVRNWATFGLGLAHVDDGSGRLGTLDSSEIREAFHQRLQDPFPEVRDEAIWGLARRKDPDGLRLLLKRLESGQGIAGDVMAAGEILDLSYDTPIEELRRGVARLLEI